MTDPEDAQEEDTQEAWVRIQKDTFANWMNDKLRPDNVKVNNVRIDLRDGVNLCKLMCALKGESIGRYTEKRNLNHYQAMANLQLALNAMQKDDIHLVNIGAEDISAGNLKLILGMCWLLIRRYQIGARSRLPTKKIMLAWINAILYKDEVSNFSADWNDGVVLHRLIEYCQPGSTPDWRTLNRMDRVANCDDALSLAERLLGIPRVVSAENMASGDLDELSMMTYLSYFMAQGGPGYNATLQWVKDTLHPEPVEDFSTSWKSGDTIVNLVQKLGCTLPEYSSSKPEGKCSAALSSSQKTFGIPPFINARDITASNADHIALMAYVAWVKTLSGHEPSVSHAPPPTSLPYDDPSPSAVPVGLKVGKQVETARESEEDDDTPEEREDEREPSEVDMYDHIETEGIYSELKDESEKEESGQEQENSEEDSYKGISAWRKPELIENSSPNGSYTEAVATSDSAMRIGTDEDIYANEVMLDNKSIERGILRASQRENLDTGQQSEQYLEMRPAGLGAIEEEEEDEPPPIPSRVYEDDDIPVSTVSTEISDVPTPVSNDDVKVVIQKEWAVDTPMTFHIKTKSAEEHQFKVLASSPLENDTQLPVVQTGPSVYDVTLTPSEKGTWTINVRDENDDDVSRSPFHFECYDVTRAEVVRDDEDSIPVGQPYAFCVRTAEVNSDRIRAHVLRKHESVPVEVTPCGTHVFKVTFTPTKGGRHVTSVYISGIQVPGSPFTVNVQSPGSVTAFGSGLVSARQRHPASFQVDMSSARGKVLDIVIMGPHLITVPTETRTAKDGSTATVTYTPPSAGTYKINITYNKMALPGSPFHPEVSHACVYVHDLPKVAIVGKSCSFTVDASEMATGTLEIDSDLPVLKYQKEAEKKYRITFVPKRTGNHDLIVKYNDVPVADSPYAVRVEGEGGS